MGVRVVIRVCFIGTAVELDVTVAILMVWLPLAAACSILRIPEKCLRVVHVARIPDFIRP